MRLAGFDVDVMACSLGPTAEVTIFLTWSFKFPTSKKKIPSLVEQSWRSSSVAEIVNDKRCLLHPVVTCLGQKEVSFSRPPLLLRLADLESTESGSDSGNDEVEETFCLYPKKYYIDEA